MSRLLPLMMIGFLVLYGSLYPFAFSPAQPDAFVRLFSDTKLLTSVGDVLGNVALFIPWGLVGLFTLKPTLGLWRSVAVVVVSGVCLALGAQVLQIWEPTRDPSMADVIWNTVGIFGGAAVGYVIAPRLSARTPRLQQRIAPAMMLAVFVLATCLPLVPSFDLQLVKNHLKLIFENRQFLMGVFSTNLALGLLCGYLLEDIYGRTLSKFTHPLLLSIIVVANLFVVNGALDFSQVIGFIFAMPLWWFLANKDNPVKRTAVWVTLFIAYTISSLSPFIFRNEPLAMSWVPFAALLDGNMLSNARAASLELLIYAGILFTAVSRPRYYLVASLGLAIWVMLLELAQIFIDGRTPDITQPLLVVIAGQILKYLYAKPVNATQNTAQAQPSPVIRTIGLKVAVALFGLTSVLMIILNLPNIPYNIKELFRAETGIFSIFFFSLALLWIGVGSVWLSRQINTSRWPELQLPLLTLLVSLISLTFLWLGVTTESIEDISGSANVYWWVTQRDNWGIFWRKVFLFLNTPELIGFVEHGVRYSALYGPVPIFLSLLMLVRNRISMSGTNIHIFKLIRIFITACMLLWFFKAIAFDWSSTDNLNELIAKDGDWGWGGGGFLYLLLLLVCVCSLSFIQPGNRGQISLGTGILVSLLSLPLGWWLLNLGLDPEVQKYGVSFSGVQFLLGPDRSHLMSTEILFLRWCAVQLGITLVLALGVKFGTDASQFFNIAKKSSGHTP
ncbi:VanZ family protein [Rhodoferax sp. U2-2l]|uniref:VanZ family protein n=1 Tax=Rhodoferax sp. U2-2l TaxID=2884000 RepID=UPI001D0B937F|nr:VanZ family protein [Rhodoferax sp. U2-2l]MCB8747160.1 VanZ family protein [Rhodoferax sp. U2-2l]